MNIFQRAWDYISGAKAAREAAERAAEYERIQKEETERRAARAAKAAERERKIQEQQRRYNEFRTQELQLRLMHANPADTDYAVYRLWLDYLDPAEPGKVTQHHLDIIHSVCGDDSERFKALAGQAGVSNTEQFTRLHGMIVDVETRRATAPDVSPSSAPSHDSDYSGTTSTYSAPSSSYSSPSSSSSYDSSSSSSSSSCSCD